MKILTKNVMTEEVLYLFPDSLRDEIIKKSESIRRRVGRALLLRDNSSQLITHSDLKQLISLYPEEFALSALKNIRKKANQFMPYIKTGQQDFICDFFPNATDIAKFRILENFEEIRTILLELRKPDIHRNSKDYAPKHLAIYKITSKDFMDNSVKWRHFFVYNEPNAKVSTTHIAYCLDNNYSDKIPRKSKDFSKIHIDSQEKVEQILQYLL